MSDALSSGTTKVCPACAEDIKVDAVVCRYCGQEFVVHRVGYCSHCHRQVEVDVAHACPTCGSPVMDVIVSSDAALTPAPTVATPSPPQPTAPPPPPAVPATAPATVPATGPGAASSPAVPPAPPSGDLAKGAGGRLALRLFAGLLIAAGIVVVVIVAMNRDGTAPSPYDLTDKFSQANIDCTKLDSIFDLESQRGLGCVSTDAQIITITTFANRPSTSSWLDNVCGAQTPGSGWKGALLSGDDFFVVIVQGPYPKDMFTPPTPKTVAGRLAGVIGGTVTTFNCDTRPSS